MRAEVTKGSASIQAAREEGLKAARLSKAEGGLGTDVLRKLGTGAASPEFLRNIMQDPEERKRAPKLAEAALAWTQREKQGRDLLDQLYADLWQTDPKRARSRAGRQATVAAAIGQTHATNVGAKPIVHLSDETMTRLLRGLTEAPWGSMAMALGQG